MYPFAYPYSASFARLAVDPEIPEEVPELLKDLLVGIQGIFADNLLAIYLRGSLATGDFAPQTSDVDFFVVTEHKLLEADFARLVAMHEQIATLPNRYALDLEGTYIDRASVRQFHPGERHPTISRHDRLAWYEHGSNWVLERWMVREHGIILLGPEPATLIDPITPGELQEAVRLRLPDWVDWAKRPDDPEWQSGRSHKAYVVETMCRALCAQATDTLQSKPRAVAWALATLPEPWRTTVERSQIWHTEQTIDVSINPEVMRFIDWTSSQCQ
ncbi:MAG TPA: aminoglycoside adenylyltransferase domain-containing protein [Ktedonobacteraceae bacterium]